MGRDWAIFWLVLAFAVIIAAWASQLPPLSENAPMRPCTDRCTVVFKNLTEYGKTGYEALPYSTNIEDRRPNVVDRLLMDYPALNSYRNVGGLY